MRGAARHFGPGCGWFRSLCKGLLGSALALLLIGTTAACYPYAFPLYPDALFTFGEGRIRLELVVDTIGETDAFGELVLTEEERREALRDLGITDEELIAFLADEDVITALTRIVESQ